MNCSNTRGDSKRRRALNRGTAGFTFLELSAAIFVLSVGIFGVLGMFQVGIAKTKVVAESMIALRAVQNEMEIRVATPFADLVVGESLPFISHTAETDGLVLAERLVTIADRSDRGLSLKEITVQLRWVTENGRVSTRKLTTLVRAKGTP